MFGERIDSEKFWGYIAIIFAVIH